MLKSLAGIPMNYSLKLLQIIEEESNYCYEDQCGIYIPVIFHLC